MLAILGFAAAGVPEGVHFGGWAVAVLALAVGLITAYATVLRFDLTMVPIALGTMIAIGAIFRAAERPYPGAVFGIVAGAALALLLGWWWFKALRRARANIGESVPTVSYQVS
jgi:hypothetical protein